MSERVKKGSIVVLRLHDSEVEETYVARALKDIDVEDLEHKVWQIKDNFESNGYWDWTYEDIFDALVKEGVLAVLEDKVEHVSIYA